MKQSWIRRLRASIFGTPLYIAAVGIVLTSLVAVLQHSNHLRERQLLFDSEVAQIEHAVADAVERQGLEFESSISFNAATHPASLDVYRTFFRREFNISDQFDPGVLLLEVVEADEIDELEARERALNRENFEVLTLWPSASDTRLVITRSARDMEAFGFPLVGLDVTELAAMMLPTEVPESGFAVRIVEPQTMFDSMLGGGGFGATQVAEDAAPALVVLAAANETPGGALAGYTIRFLNVDDLLEDVAEVVPDELNVKMYVPGIEDSVAEFGADEVESPQFSTSRGQQTASLDWRLEVDATSEFGQTLGFLDHGSVWLLGLPLSLIAALMVVVSEYHRRRLDEAAFEVEHAMALASTDPLTGLLNRQGLIDAARDLDGREPASLFFVDLDGFKVVNDEDGHDEGDRVLREVARRLRGICRPQDFVCRLGGDEFVMFTPGAGSEEHMVEVSSRITIALAEVDQRVTSSVGVAARRGAEEVDVKELLRQADREMYEAKRAGGDQYSVVSVAE